jgi:DNA-binding NarL/FixJ family response regulator
MGQVSDADPIPLSPALVVEDDPAVQRRLRRLLVEQGLAPDAIDVAGSVAAAECACGARSYGFALVDIGLPDGSGLGLVEWMRREHPRITPIVVSAFGTEALIVAALRGGAAGYLLKERDDAELLASLRTIERGGAPIDPFVARHILHLVGTPAGAASPAAGAGDGEPLTARELEILGWVAQGLISREIAQRLDRSPQTIECHIKNIFRKMCVSTRTEAVHRARQRGLLH